MQMCLNVVNALLNNGNLAIPVGFEPATIGLEVGQRYPSLTPMFALNSSFFRRLALSLP